MVLERNVIQIVLFQFFLHLMQLRKKQLVFLGEGLRACANIHRLLSQASLLFSQFPARLFRFRCSLPSNVQFLGQLLLVSGCLGQLLLQRGVLVLERNVIQIVLFQFFLHLMQLGEQ